MKMQQVPSQNSYPKTEPSLLASWDVASQDCPFCSPLRRPQNFFPFHCHCPGTSIRLEDSSVRAAVPHFGDRGTPHRTPSGLRRSKAQKRKEMEVG